jgi:hypothetical protein
MNTWLAHLFFSHCLVALLFAFAFAMFSFPMVFFAWLHSPALLIYGQGLGALSGEMSVRGIESRAQGQGRDGCSLVRMRARLRDISCSRRFRGEEHKEQRTNVVEAGFGVVNGGPCTVIPPQKQVSLLGRFTLVDFEMRNEKLNGCAGYRIY